MEDLRVGSSRNRFISVSSSGLEPEIAVLAELFLTGDSSPDFQKSGSSPVCFPGLFIVCPHGQRGRSHASYWRRFPSFCPLLIVTA